MADQRCRYLLHVMQIKDYGSPVMRTIGNLVHANFDVPADVLERVAG
jgi:hypothetical protein